MAEAFIVAALRTAGGRKGGRLAGWHPADLAAQVIDALVARVGMDPAQIDDVILGCVGQAGEQSFNIARNAILASSLPESVPGVSVDRQCGSSQQAVHFAAQAVLSGTMDLVIAGGVESMTRVPMGLPATLPFKHGFGSYMSPAMQARYPGVQFSQFTGAEQLAVKYGLSKDALDDYALASHQRAAAATRRKTRSTTTRSPATSVLQPRHERAASRARSCRCRRAWPTAQQPATCTRPTKASASMPRGKRSPRSS